MIFPRFPIFWWVSRVSTPPSPVFKNGRWPSSLRNMAWERSQPWGDCPLMVVYDLWWKWWMYDGLCIIYVQSMVNMYHLWWICIIYGEYVSFMVNMYHLWLMMVVWICTIYGLKWWLYSVVLIIFVHIYIHVCVCIFVHWLIMING